MELLDLIIYLIFKIYAIINHQYIDIHLIKKQTEIFICSFIILLLKTLLHFTR